MSLKKTATRRLALLAGSSLVAAGLSAAVFTGVAATPGVAYAYDECVPANPPTTLTDGTNGVSDPTLNGATADAFACSATTYPSGITYSSAGDLTVTKTNATTTTVTANGVNLTGAGADSVTWNSSAGTVTGGAGTAGPVIDVTSVSGPISIITAGVTGTQAGTTHAIRATSTGGGAITITRAAGGVNNSVAGGVAAIEAVTNGGNISVTTAGGATNGRLRGILAQTSGAGSVTMSISSAVNASTIDGVAAIDVTAGTGPTSITIDRGTINGGAGSAIVATSAGNVVINNLGGQIGGASFGIPTSGGSVNFSAVTGPGVTFNNSGAGYWLATGSSVFSAGDDLLTMSGTGQNQLGTGAIIDLGGGNDTFSLSGNLFDNGGASIRFGAGADVFNLSGLFRTNGTTLDFGTDTDTFNLTGVLGMEGLTINNLEAFNNAGVIYMGGTTGTGSDGFADDVFALNGVAYTGSGAGRIVMDVDLEAGGQADCQTLTGAADCLDLRNGSTAGVTLLTVNDVTADAARGANIGVTLVDVAGGTSAAGHFVLDPNSAGFTLDPTFGAVLGRPGLFAYSLRYDAENQRHALVGVPRSEAMEYAMLSSAAHSIWHMTAETVTDRQTDMRGATDGGVVWLRTSGEYSKRDVSTAFDVFDDSFAFDNGYKLYAGTIMGGMDFVSGRSGDYDYVLGGQVGYVGSSFDLNASGSSGRMTGATGGVYASAWNGLIFVDGTFNANFLTLDYDSPGLGSKTNTYLNSFGARLEGGRRFMLTERMFVDPLATVAFVRTAFEEISLAGGEVEPDDAQSLRGALGLRIGGDAPGETVNFSYFLTGRAWNEFKGESGGTINNPGADLAFADDTGGSFTEAEAGLSLFNDANTLAGFLTSGVKAMDGYSAVNLSLGLQMRW